MRLLCASYARPFFINAFSSSTIRSIDDREEFGAELLLLSSPISPGSGVACLELEFEEGSPGGTGLSSSMKN